MSPKGQRSSAAGRRAWPIGLRGSRASWWTPEGRAVLDFAKAEEGWFQAPVPPGQDGKLWKFENSQGQRLLMTVPPYLARSAEELLLPQEVVEADRKP